MNIEEEKFPELKMQNQQDQKKEELRKIEEVLKQCITNSNLPQAYFSYLSNMIIEEPPRNVSELTYFAQDFIQNNPQITQDETKQICQDIFDKLKQIIHKEKSRWVARRLNQPIIMEKVQLISQREEDAGYTDTPFSFEQLRYQNKQIDKDSWKNNSKLIKRQDKEKQKRKLVLQKRQEEMEALKYRLPPVQVLHTGRGNYSLDIKVDRFTLEISGKVLIENGQLLLANGRKYGLIGQNGIGKTTLMYAIVRKEIEKMNSKPQILMIEQEVQGTDETPLDIILATDGERKQLLEEEKEIINQEGQEARLQQIYARLDEIQANKAEARACALLKGLGFTQKMINEKSKLLSGGWRMRVALAKVLFCEPDILLLDEPTNHLDLDAVLWLEDYLRTFQNTVVVVSHAREFLNEVCTDIIHLVDQQLIYYRGGFESFEKQREANLIRKQREFEAQQKHIKHIKEFVDRFRFNAKKASLVQSRLKYLNKIEKIEQVISDDPNYVFKFQKPESLRSPIIRIDEGFFRYNQNEKYLLKNLNFSVDQNTKVALLGANGVGKTTFLKLLMEELKIEDGNYFRETKARVQMFSQHHVDKLNLQLSPLEQYYDLYPDISSNVIRNHLGSFGIAGNLVMRPMYLLSGGQKSRVSLSLAAWTNPHILIMDEPTNHLDMESVDALILALNNFKGGLLIVSHDQYFVSCVCDEIWYIKNGNMKKFYGDFDNYRNALVTDKL